MVILPLLLNVIQNIPNIPIDADTPSRNLLGGVCLAVIDAGVGGAVVAGSGSPKGIFDDAGGIVSIAHHFRMMPEEPVKRRLLSAVSCSCGFLVPV